MQREKQENQVQILSIAEGFLYANILFALHRLGVFRILGKGPKTLAELATELQCEQGRLERLLRGGLVAKVLYTDQEKRYCLSRFVENTVGPAADPSLDAWLRFLSSIPPALWKLDEAVTSAAPVVEFFSEVNEREVQQFTLAMHNYAKLRGSEIADYLDLKKFTTLLDLGAGPGTYAFELAARNPHLRISLLDLPVVLQVAREIEKEYKLATPPHYLPLDFGQEEIPGAFDVVLISNTLHTIGHADSCKLLERVYPKVNPGGCVVVQAQFLPDQNPAKHRWPVMLDLILLSITPRGENHSLNQTIGWMREAGFRDISSCRMGLLNTNSYVIGYR